MKSKQIKSYEDSLFRNIIVNPSNYSFSENSLDYLHSLIRDFSKSAFDNLSEYPYIYLTSGITEFLNFYLSSNSFESHDKDYRYLKIFNKRKEGSDLLYYSYPFSGTGKFHNIPTDKPVLLDCAYMFASNLNSDKILPINVQFVTFSLSKSHNLSDLRVGWVFSKVKIPQYHIVQYEYKYINSLYIQIFENISLYRPNELYLRNKEFLRNLYLHNDCIEPDTNLFGLRSDERIPYYSLIP